MKWEYKIYRRPSHVNDTELDSELQTLGHQGWEMVTATGTTTFVFKRPLAEEPADKVLLG